MRTWSLHPGDPLSLTLAADARLCTPDYTNDHIWELELGSGEPGALSLRTTYGLRARSMRIFPRFVENRNEIIDPAAFAEPPCIRKFYPNFLQLEFSPMEGIEVTSEYWAPVSQVIANRLTIKNGTPTSIDFSLEICAVLFPLEGSGFRLIQHQMVKALGAESGNLAPVIFLTGGPDEGEGAYPALCLNVKLEPGERRQYTWAQAALSDHQASFDLARLTAARQWDAERARIELVNTADHVDIRTGDPDWDAALAFSQSTAFSLFFNGNDHLPKPSFVLARQPDHGYSRTGDGSDYPSNWNGQAPLDSYYLSSLLPGAPRMVRHLFDNYLAAQSEGGYIDCKPGLGGQHGNFLAAPLIASLAWKVFLDNQDVGFLENVFSPLLKFFWAWFSPSHDRDGNGLPEWEHLLQTGFEENPLHDLWNPWSQGVDITCVQSPALLAMLFHEAQSLIKMAQQLHQQGEASLLSAQAEKLREAVENSWSSRSGLYQYTDRDTGLTQKGKILAKRKGPGDLSVKTKLEKASRLLVEITTEQTAAARPQVSIHEFVTKEASENLSSGQFQWRTGGLAATTQQVFNKVGKVKVRGIGKQDQVVVRTIDLSIEDHTLLTPLWAGIPDLQRAQNMIGRAILDAQKFDRPFGLPACPSVPDPQAETFFSSVYLPWNQLVGEGLLAYGFRNEAARLVAHLLTGIIKNLKKSQAFYQHYHAEIGSGLGERNSLVGLAPVGLFLKALGIERISPKRLHLTGLNPFPWSVTIKYRDLAIVCHSDRTEISFPNRPVTTVIDSFPCTVAL
ncbi:MAG: hypothetical protein JXA13_12145 [Anaerolineales bacterium]|nr:hypothetical protein [Anaerolineales bacterium]